MINNGFPMICILMIITAENNNNKTRQFVVWKFYNLDENSVVVTVSKSVCRYMII